MKTPKQFDDDLQRKISARLQQLQALADAGEVVMREIVRLGRQENCEGKEFGARLRQEGVAAERVSEVAMIMRFAPVTLDFLEGRIGKAAALAQARAIKQGLPRPTAGELDLARAATALIRLFPAGHPFSVECGLWRIEFVPDAPADAPAARDADGTPA